jgi:hypothetical protein
MLVKVNDEFKGTFGQYDETAKTVYAKKAGDDPFVVSDVTANRMIQKGILVAVGGGSPVSSPEPEEPVPAPEIPEDVEETKIIERKLSKKGGAKRKGSNASKRVEDKPPVITAEEPE